MTNITSVSASQQPAKRALGIVLIVIGASIALCVGTIGFLGDTIGMGIGGIIFGLFWAGIGVIALIIAKPNYFVRIGSASGEANALSSRDLARIQAIVKAMNQAIIDRG